MSNYITTCGQFGNILWHYYSALHALGKVDGLCCLGISLTQYHSSTELLHELLDVPTTKGMDYHAPIPIRRHLTSNWQSISVIPPRDICRRQLKDILPMVVDYEYVMHIRGGDYFSYFRQGGDSITFGKRSIAKLLQLININAEQVLVVTDDPAYVKSLGINFGAVQSSSTKDDWMTLYHAKRLIMSPSTFAWWAGYLGLHELCIMPLGIGPWDNHILDNDLYSAHSNKELCWGDECVCMEVL